MLSLLVTFILTAFATGNPITIHNVDEFVKFAQTANNGTSYRGVTIFLYSDLDLTNVQISPIGNQPSVRFSCIFNGQGHTISNLKIESSGYAGLFGITNDATIANIVLDSTCSFSGINGFIGSIAGYFYAPSASSKIFNSVNMASVTYSGASNFDISIGGIAGYITDGDGVPTTRNCANFGTVTFFGSVSAESQMGGIVGAAGGGFVQNCVNYGSLVYIGNATSLYIGGIAGSVYNGVLTNNVNIGLIKVSGPNSKSGSIVGLLDMYSGLSNCYWDENVGYEVYGSKSFFTTEENYAKFNGNFVLNKTVSAGSYQGNSVIEALNSVSESRGFGKWMLSKKKLNVKFVVNGDNYLYEDAQLIMLPSLLGMGDKIFAGWYTDSACTTLLSDYKTNTFSVLYGRKKKEDDYEEKDMREATPYVSPKSSKSPSPSPATTPDYNATNAELCEADIDSPTQATPTNAADVKTAYDEPEHHGSITKIVLSITFYFVVSISLVFLNKYLMRGYSFPYPIFVTWYQQIVSLASLFVCSKMCSYFLPEKYVFIPPLEFDFAIARQIFPLTFLFVCMLSFNNLCLRYVEVWFYQVARSLTILFTICISYFYFGVSTSRKTICACVIVIFGFILGSVGRGGGDSFKDHGDNPTRAKMAGIAFGLLSSVFVSLYGIFVKRKLAVVANNEWRLLNYNTAISFWLIVPVIFIAGESKVLSEPILRSPRFWVDMTVTGVFSFLICVAIFIQVKFTSPLTNNISGTAKACCQTILAIFVWHSKVSFEGVLGIILVLGGSGWYSFIRYQEMMERKKAATSTNVSSGK